MHEEHLMQGHQERVARYEATRKRRSAPQRMRRDLTAAQLHQRACAGADLDLGKRVQASGLWVGKAFSRKVWCARLRELELHPERLEQIKWRGVRRIDDEIQAVGSGG